jgi:hypothetical protein
LGEVSEDAPVTRLIGVGQSGAGYAGTKAHVVQLTAHRADASFYVAQALAISQLCESHGKELLPAGEFLRIPVAAVMGNAFLKLFVGQMLNQL